MRLRKTNAARKEQKEEGAGDKPEEQEENAPEKYLGWQAANDGTQRLVLAGDSILVTRWCNGHWPVRNRGLGDIMEGCKERLVKLWSTLNVRPGCNWTDFVRHQKRKWNKECDHLAGLGKEETPGKLCITIVHGCVPCRFWNGVWDGGYNPGEKQVGIGYKVWTTVVGPQRRCEVRTKELDREVLCIWDSNRRGCNLRGVGGFQVFGLLCAMLDEC